MAERTAASIAEELKTLDGAHVMATYPRQPVAFARGEGATLYDTEGEPYLDFLAGISVCNAGHCHPTVVEAIREQAGLLTHTSNLYLTEPGVRLAGRLASSFAEDARVFLANSGAEANEAAIKLARKHRRGGEIVVFEGGFHGRTMGALSATPQETKQEPFAPLVPGFVVVARDDLSGLQSAVTERTAAVMLEPIQGESGVWPMSEDLLVAAREACDRTGALLVFDEIQCGMGRTGTLWAFEGTPVEPDVFTTAKSLASGLPIGACVARGEAGACSVSAITAPRSVGGRSWRPRRWRRST
jgi:acetylornithine/succinyldiaminopimelate/putrescine aminotransferase